MGMSENFNKCHELLDETVVLLSRTAVKSRFEKQLAALAIRFHSAPANYSTLMEIHVALTELRKQLRFLGYDLTQSKYILIFDGFHSDEVFNTFTRVVLFIDKSGIFYGLTGDENHITLSKRVEEIIKRIRGYQIIQKHYLWFKRTKSTLTLSGADTESAEAYEQLKALAEADNLLFLSRIKKIC
jgi:hypothetical protein